MWDEEVQAWTGQLRAAPRRVSGSTKEMCACVVVQMWAHAREVSAPLEGPDAHGKSVHM